MKLSGWVWTLLLAAVVVAGYFYFYKKPATVAAVPQPKAIMSFMGAPGSGKGTLAENCIKELKYTKLSTGDIFREEVAKGTDLGKTVDSFMKEGKLVPDDIVMSVVDVWLAKNLPQTETLILDGFPRTARQAELFLELLRTKYSNVSFRVIDLKISDDAIVKRLADRLVCEKCQAPYSKALLKESDKLICEKCGGKLIQREDDKEEVVRNRLKVYAETAKPLLDAYQAAKVKIDQIDVENKKPEQVFEEFKALVKEPAAPVAEPAAPAPTTQPAPAPEAAPAPAAEPTTTPTAQSTAA